MLKAHNSSAIVAVSDLTRARAFYEDVLGLTRLPGGEQSEALTYQTGDTFLNVYRSDFAGTNRANAVTWNVGADLTDIVADLRAKGVAFEDYGPIRGMTFEDGVYSAGPVRLVWFKDPDGNILHLIEGMNQGS